MGGEIERETGSIVAVDLVSGYNREGESSGYRNNGE